MNLNAPSQADRLAARIEMGRRRIPKAVAARIVELSDNGMSVFEVASILGIPLQIIRLVLRGGAPP